MATYNYILTDIETSEVKILEAFPASWADTVRNYDRDNTYHGIFRMYTLSMRFMNVGGEPFDKGGYWFLKNIYDRDGIKGKVQIEREKLNNFNNQFEPDLIGIIDFTADAGFKINRTEQFIEANVIDSSKLQNFVANDEKNINLLDTTAINGNALTPFSDTPKIANVQGFNIYLDTETSGTLDRRVTDQTGNIVVENDYIRIFQKNLMGERYFESGEKIYENTYSEDRTEVTFIVDYDWTFEASVVFSVFGFVNVRNTIIGEIRDSTNYLKRTIEYHNSLLDFQGTGYYSGSDSGSVNTTDEYTFEPGDYMNIFIRVEVSENSYGTVNATSAAIMDNYDIIETYESVAETETETFLTDELTQRAVQIMTGELDSSKLVYANIFGRTDSEYQTYSVDGALAYLGTSYGLKVRNFPDSQIPIVFKTWFKSIDRMANIALWFDKENDRFRIEEKEQVYKDELILDFGVVSKLIETPYKDGYYSQLLTGTTEKGDYEEIQGAKEYNIQTQHSIDMPVKDKLDLRVPYNIDPLSIEFARRSQYKTTGSTDTKHDNKVMIYELDSSLETITNTDFVGFMGVNERYNGNYTPKKCLYNNCNWIWGIFFRESGNGIKFETSTKNTNVGYPSEFFSSVEYEQEFIRQNLFNTPLFYPRLFEFEFYINNDQMQQIDNDPHGYCRFESENGDIFYGYIITLEINDFKGTGKGTFIEANINR